MSIAFVTLIENENVRTGNIEIDVFSYEPRELGEPRYAKLFEQLVNEARAEVGK